MIRKFLAIAISLLLTTGVLPTMQHPTLALPLQTDVKPTELISPLSTNLVEHQISSGQIHFYSIDLLSDQFIYVDVQQLGVDVTVSLFDTDSNLLIETNAPDLSYGAEPFYWVAQKPGAYKIAIKPAEVAAKPGKYTIKLVELRTAKDEDYHFLDGQQKLVQAEKSRSQATKQSLLDSISFYDRAIEHWQIAGQKERQGVCLNLKAFVIYYSGDITTAIKYFNEAAQIRPRGGGKAQSVTNLAIMHRLTGETDKALEYFTEALQLSHEIGDKQAEAIILNGMGNLHDGFGNKQEAISCYSEALKLSREIGSRLDEATSLHNIGSVFSAFGEADKAISFFTEALPIWDEVNDFHNKLVTLNQIGNTYMVVRDLDKALEFYFKVVEIASEKGQNKDKGIALSQIGYVFSLMDEKEKSLSYLQQGLELCVNSKYKFGESITLSRLATIYSLLNEKDKALIYFNKALEIAKLIGDKKLEGDILFKLSSAYQRAGDLDSAVTQIKKAIDLSENLRANFSNQQLKTYYFVTTNNYYQLYVDLLMSLHEKEPTKGYDAQALYIHELSRARTLLEVIKEGRVDIREGVDHQLVDQEQKLNTSITNKTENLFRLLKKANYSEEERAKLEKEIHQLDIELEQVQAKIREHSPRYSAIKQPNPLTLQEIQKEVLDNDTLLLEYSLGKESSYLWAVTKTSINSYKLPKKDVIEALAIPLQKYYTTSYHLENESEEFRKERLAKEEAFAKSANKFSNLILEPVASLLGKKRLLVVTDGVLSYTPFAGLPKPGTEKTAGEIYPLVVDHEIVTAPSASTVAVLRKEFTNRKPATNSVFVLADPIFTSDDQRLAINGKKTENLAVNVSNKTKQPNISLSRGVLERSNLDRLNFSAQEAKTISEIFADEKPKMVLGVKADLEAVTSSEISQYRNIHLSTHGFINNIQPEMSGLVLSLFDDDGKEKNGYLTANYIFNLKLNAELVVLSACQSGFGREIRGEGILGLTRGFLYAGAERVMFTLWNVNDQSTSVLMTKFYTAMKKEKLTPAAALRQAQISMWKDKKWTSPYYWAAFQLVGEWQKK